LASQKARSGESGKALAIAARGTGNKMTKQNEHFQKPSEAERRRKHLTVLADRFLDARGNYIIQEAKWRAIEAKFIEDSKNLRMGMKEYKSFKLARNSMLIEYDIERDSGELEVSPLTNLDRTTS